jgi:hypothetical protein
MKYTSSLVVVALLSTTAAWAASPWDGAYLFEQPIGPGAGGLQLFVNHKLTIGPEGGPNGCRIEADGFQTNERLLCKATPNGDKLDVMFASYADGKQVNAHGVKIYQPNQKLFTLGHKGNAVTTDWAGYSMNKTIGAKPGEDTFKKM